MKYKKISKILFLAFILLFGITNIAQADATDINLTIRDGNSIIFSEAVPLPPVGNIELNSHSLNADSVLSIVNNADISSPSFIISDLQYYDSFGSFYLKCIASSAGNDCDNWQYTVNDVYPGVGMDQKILSGGENVYLYFGPQYQILINPKEITTTDTITATTEEYNYKTNSWKTRTGITVGLTQPDPLNSSSSIEIQTAPVNENGQASFSSIPTGSYSVGVKEDFYFPTQSLTVIAPIAQSSGAGGGGITFSPPVQEKEKFNLQKAFEFLISQQQEDGSFGEDLYTDWISLAFSSNENFQDQKNKLKIYFQKLKPVDYHLTDYERHAMALMSLNLDPYNVNGENYIKKIVDSFNGKQFGDINKDNDDIFALIVLQNTGYTKDDEIIKNDITFILEAQNKDGSWDKSIDMTGAGIEALAFLDQDEQVKNALIKAKEFLKQNQKNDGGFGNVSSTAWAIEGILALGEHPKNWIKNNNSPLDYLALNQDIDGGTKNNDKKSKLWETAYAVSALSDKTWSQIMQKFDKPKPARSVFSTTNAGEEEIKIKNEITTKKLTKKTTLQDKIILETKETPIQAESTVIRPASISTLSAFLRFLIPVLDKIL